MKDLRDLKDLTIHHVQDGKLAAAKQEEKCLREWPGVDGAVIPLIQRPSPAEISLRPQLQASEILYTPNPKPIGRQAGSGKTGGEVSAGGAPGL